MSKLLYTPSKDVCEQANITKFSQLFSQRLGGKSLETYHELHNTSIEHKGLFWDCVRDFCHVIGNFPANVPVYKKGTHIWEDKYFSKAYLNYAENLLSNFSDPKQVMMRFSSEGQDEFSMTFAEVKRQVINLQNYLYEAGFRAGDRAASIMPNRPETVIAMLAVTSLGGVWASCSPDFGIDSIEDRFGQIDPKVIFICDSYRYNGKIIDMSDKIKALTNILPKSQMTIMIPFERNKACGYTKIVNQKTTKEIEYVKMPFNAPLFIMFSSGTTGKPKSIIHSIGGTLLQHLKEHRLHCNLNKGDNFFYYTTCGWMMWNWSVSALASGMPLLLYDGSPMAPNEDVLFDYISKHKATIFGTSAKFIDSVRKSGFIPKDKYDLSALKIITSTGSPLSNEGFDFVYDSIKKDVHLASISGGTDIISCFVLGVPTLPVYSGEIQGKGLGMDVKIFDETGVETNEKGELICASSFVSMPIGFWNDKDGQKYHKAYFDSFENIWSQGDFAQETEHGGIVIYGRSDAVLNPGGVRIGTAEIYRQVEKLDEVLEAVCIGQDWEDDVRVVLFVKLRENLQLSEELINKIKAEIKNGATPRHVPALIKQVPDIPRTKSGKITEIAVRDIVNGKSIANTGALANPEALDYYRNIV